MGRPDSIVICGAGAVFRQKIKPALQGLGISRFFIYDPGPAPERPDDQLRLERLEDAPARLPVLILSPNRFHLEQTLGFMERGHPVYLEKPAVVSAREGRRLARALAANPGARLYCGDYYLFKAWPLLALLKPAWAAGDGPPLSSSTKIFSPMPALPPSRIEGRYNETETKSARRPWLDEPGGGVLLDLLLHYLNILCILELPPLKIEEARRFKNLADGGRKLLTAPDEAENGAEVLARGPGGIAIRLSVSNRAPETRRFLRFIWERGPTLTMVFGEDENFLEVENHAQNGRLTLAEAPYVSTMRQALDFLRDPFSSGAAHFDGQLMAIEAIEAIRKASR